MTVEFIVDIAEGQLGVTSDCGFSKEPCIVIPVSVVASLDTESIGEYSKRLVEYAWLAKAVQVADQLLCDGPDEIESWHLEKHAEKFAMLEKYAGRDPLIDQALAAAQAARIREAHREEAPQKRKEIRNNYKRIFDKLVKRDGRQCVYCTATDNLQIDHVVAVINGGTNNLDNLQLLCATCNMAKSDKP